MQKELVELQDSVSFSETSLLKSKAQFGQVCTDLEIPVEVVMSLSMARNGLKKKAKHALVFLRRFESACRK
jgi:hypothetical protein